MAHIFIGERTRIDSEILVLVGELPDDYWAYFEFSVGRNVDLLIARAATENPSVLIMTELKRISRPLTGTENGPWSVMTEAGTIQEIEPLGGRDINYYWQAVNTANAMAEWLWNNQQRYRRSADVLPLEDFKIWPDLLLLSPPTVMHRLPLAPASRYGRWWYNEQDWLRHVRTWRPRQGVALDDGELDALGAALDLRPLTDARPREEEPRPGDADALLSFVSWLRSLDERIGRLERQLAVLSAAGGDSPKPISDAAERNTTASGQTLYHGDSPKPISDAAEPSPTGHSFVSPRLADGGAAAYAGRLSDELRDALTAAIAESRDQGRSRALPAVLELMDLRIGYRLKDTQYQGFGSARRMFDQAVSEGLIKYGPLSGPNPTLYLPNEAVPPADRARL